MAPLRICLVAAEVTPFAKAGGLADVVAALARHLDRAGHEVRLVMPLYGRMRELPFKDTGTDLELRVGERHYQARVRLTDLPDSNVAVRCIDAPDLYGGEALYRGDEEDAFRFAALTKAAFEVCQREGFAPDVMHAHDWHTALAPLYLRTAYEWDQLFANTRSVLTIHNLAYQGKFPAHMTTALGLDDRRDLLHQEHLDEGYFSFMETGILYATAISTVSHTYSHQIQGEEYGEGLEGLLRARADHLIGIPNGIDVDEWDPASDPHLPAHYDASDLSGKRECKRALFERFGLATEDLDVPVLGCVSRLTPQKGFELVPDALPVLLHREDLRFVILGSGEDRYESYFHWLQETFPTKVGFWRGYDEPLSHLIEAGSDLFLMPSRFEPCGLNQMYSLRYGTLPIVRRTGGLADTVEPIEPGAGTGTGIVFDDFSSHALLGALEHAISLYRQPDLFLRIQRNAMERDFSWENQIGAYEDLFRRLPEL
ncbi:MAG: glycogen synthase GlgA [Planctomycetota bacterium]|nr:glycogen synthase GlgA [Planctomycetota bacterium]